MNPIDKIRLNSVYPKTASVRSPLYDPELATAITKSAQKLAERIDETFEDTDSIMPS